MTWNIPLRSAGFQSPMPKVIQVDTIDLFWGAITVGRPNIQTVLSHGKHSISEMLFRWNMMKANLVMVPTVSGLSNSSAFNALDPTEKAWVNYSLGMIFTKLCAQKVLKTAWLMHFAWFAKQYNVRMQGSGSTPDFMGLCPYSGRYHVLEAKGRNAGYSASILKGAKEQACQPISVNGVACDLHIGAMLYRLSGQQLAFAWVDPKPEGEDRMETNDTHQTWIQYYKVAWDLFQLEEPQRLAIKQLTGFEVSFDEYALDYIRVLMNEDGGKDWKAARDGLISWSAERFGGDERKVFDVVSGRRSFSDGVVLKYEPPFEQEKLIE